MPPLAELQARFARAVIETEAAPIAGALVGGARPIDRLEVHRRHYRSSLTTALREKFPACEWLVGTALLTEAARAFVRDHPPARPCIAEYGADFPQYLGGFSAPALPYLGSFGELEWAVGRVSIEVNQSALAWAALTKRSAEHLFDATLTLQSGLRYVRSRWRIATLMSTYLGGAEDHRFELSEADTFIEVRGERGHVSVTALDAGTFHFRAALMRGETLGRAVEAGIDHDAKFETGAALRALSETGTIVDIASIAEQSA